MKYELSETFTDRYKKLLKSDVMKDVHEYSKSEYWKYHASKVEINIESTSITATGKSGFYTSESNNILEIIIKLSSAFKNPSKLLRFAKRKIGIPLDGVKLLDYFNAFEKVMERSAIADPDLSPFRINFGALKNNNKVFASTEKCKNDYLNIVGGR
jgi:hypothetical protein